MSKIHRLDEHLTNMIAAGEVVERPQGIVKELVENSIDAMAKRIEITLVQGGLEMIEIMDDGIGMDKEDACLAFERHATSKIGRVEDLWSIHTMGFRGEALPSIASVSNLVLLTNDGTDSTRIEINYGKMVSARPYPTNQGTQISVGGLFLKTPARLKHLKTPQYEASLVLDVVQKFALSHPEISFRLISDNREVFRTTGKGNLLEVIYAIYGKEAASNAVELKNEDFDYKLSGAAMLPVVNRATKNYITMFINGRMIRNYRIQKAILDGYHDYIPKERFPIVVLNIEMDAQLVDVNVHPSKWEIRLSKEQQLELLIVDTIKEAIGGKIKAPDIRFEEEKVHVEQPALFETATVDTKETVNVQENYSTREFIAPVKEVSQIKQDYPAYNEPVKRETVEKKVETIEEEPVEYLSSKKFPSMMVLAQMHGSYILCQGDDGLYIVDQHAAQERVHFEEIIEKFNNPEPIMTHLLIPLVIEGNAEIVNHIEELNEGMAKFRIQFELFGNNSLMVRDLPIWTNQINEQAFLQDVVDLFKESRTFQVENLQRHRLATMACHHSIRFNRVLSLEEMQQVINELAACKQPFHCPHGRPTFLHISNAQLRKEFNR